MGIFSITYGTQTVSLKQPRELGWEGGGRDVQDGGNMCTYSWFMLMFGKNRHNAVK